VGSSDKGLWLMGEFGRSNGGGRRSAARAATPLPAVLITVTRAERATLADISCGGARLTGHDLPPKGEVLELKVEQVRVFGTVAWCDRTECGIAFDAPLMPFEVERLRRSAGIPALAQMSVDERQALEDWLLGVSR
jgi:hypothetical protein